MFYQNDMDAAMIVLTALTEIDVSGIKFPAPFQINFHFFVNTYENIIKFHMNLLLRRSYAIVPCYTLLMAMLNFAIKIGLKFV